MLNSGLRGRRTKDSKGIVSVADQFNQQQYLIPTVTSFSITDESYVPLDDEAVDSAGGQTIVVNGSGFAPGATVTVGGDTISVVTFIDSGRLAFTAPAKISGSYTIFVTNSTGGTGILVPGLVYSGVPTWSSPAAGPTPYASIYETKPLTQSFVATGDAPLTYSLYSGSLPSGATLGSDGTLTGDAPVESGSTTYSFTVKATDAENQDSLRSFSLTINTDVVTWSTPDADQSYSVSGGTEITAVTLSATSAAGYDVQYAANTLPAGLSLSGNSITGTPTSGDTIYTQLTATANTTGRSATRTISWTISLGDSNWKYVSLLLNGSTSVPTFINDASLENSQLTIAGDTRPSNLNPYAEGYYSYNLDGAGYILGTLGTAVTIGTNDFCLEGWGYWTSFNFGSYGAPLISLGGATAGELMIRATKTSGTTTSANFFNIVGGSTYIPSSMYNSGISVGTLKLNTWHHLAVQRVSGTWYFYVDGVMLNSTSAGNASLTLPFNKCYIGNDLGGGNGYMQGNASNVRLTVGSAPYATGGFTPPSTPLQVAADTKFLSAQSNRFKDNGPGNAVFTSTSVSKVLQVSPFTPNSSYRTYGSAYFDGTGDYLTIPHNKSLYLESGDFTIEFWYNSSIAFNTGYGPCIGFGYKSTPTGGWVIYRNTVNNTNSISFRVAGQGGAGMVDFATVSTAEKDTWNHWAVVRSGTSLKWYKNGILDASTTNSINITDTDSTTLGYVGYAQQWGYAAQGYLADVRVVKGTALYTTNFTPPTQPLTAVTNTKLLTCQYNGGATNTSFIDKSAYNNILTRLGNTTQGSFSPYGPNWSVNFNRGRVNSTLTGKSPGTGSFTYEFFFNVSVKDAAIANVAALFSTRGGGSGADGFDVQITTAGAVQIGTSGSTLFTSSSGLVANGSWHHMAIVRNGSTNWTIYLNGSSIGTISNSSNLTSVDFYLGVFGGTGNDWFKGYISNFRYTRSAVYTENFTVPSTSLTAITNTELLCCQSNRHKDNSPNNFTITPFTVNGTPTIQAVSPFADEVVAGAGSIFMDGTGDYLTAVNSKSFDLSTGPWTIECWFYQLAAKTVQLFSVSAASWRMAVASNGGAEFTFNGSSTMSFAAGTFPPGQWNHMAVTYNASGTSTAVKAFANGKLLSSGQFWPNADTTSLFYVGNNKDAAGAWDFNGYITDIRITRGEALYSSDFAPMTSPAQLTNYTSFLLNGTNGGIVDAHGTNNLDTVGNTTLASEDPYGGSYYSNYFDGTGDKITYTGNTAFNFGSGDFTIEAWVNAQSFGNSGVVLFSNFVPNSVRLSLYLSSTGLLVDSGSQMAFSGTTTCSLGTWYHCAFVRSGSSFKTYVNGVQVSTATYADAYWVTANTDVVVGDYSDDYSTGYGYISNLRVIKGQALYTGNFTPSVNPLNNATVGSTGAGAASSITGTVSLLTCQSNSFKDNSLNNFTAAVSGNPFVKSMNPFQQNTGKSLYFDGTGDYIANYTGAVNLVDDKFIMQGNFTVEAWIYPSSTNIGIVTLGNETTNRFIFFLSSSRQLSYDIYLTGTTTFTPTIPLNSWSHVALVRSGSTITGYLNGDSIGTGSSSATLGSGPLSIGVSAGRNSAYWSGYIKDLRITKGVARTITVPKLPYEVK